MTPHAPDMPADILLRVRGLTKLYGGDKKTAPMKALDNVSFDMKRGETLGVVGESGSGKTTTARCVLRAIDPNSGEAWFNNNGKITDLAAASPRDLKPLRKEMQMIFQDPFASLNPRMTVGDIVAEPLVIHGIGSRKERRDKVIAILERCGLKAEHLSRYPHAFSGGQRQRIGIARALILRPAFVVADEAVSALDVCVRARVLKLLSELKAEFGLTMMFVSHDLSVIRTRVRPRDRDVSRADHGTGPGGNGVQQSAARLHRGAAVGDSAP